MTLEQEVNIRWVFGMNFDDDEASIPYIFEELLDEIFDLNQQDKICDEMYDDPSKIDDQVPGNIMWWIESYCQYNEPILDNKLISCIGKYAVQYFHEEAKNTLN